MLRCPSTIHKHVVKICSLINSREIPVFVDVVPEPGALKDECFFNVQAKINKDRGSVLHGWCLWELPGIFIEGEFHGVWVSPDNKLIDVTPKKDGESSIIFLPDPTQVFDEKTFTRRDNFRLAIKDHAAVHSFIRAAEALNEYQELGADPSNPRQFRVNSQIYQQLVARQNYFAGQMMLLEPGRNDPCTCGSGTKFKKCCGK